MAIVAKSNDFIALDSTGLRSAPVILPGTKAIFDFAGVADSLLVADTVSNIWPDGDQATVVGTFLGGNKLGKGLRFVPSDDYTSARLDLPKAFDLNTLGTTPSLLLSIMFTPLSIMLAGSADSIAGHAYQTGAECQWSLYTTSAGSGLQALIAGAGYNFGAQTAGVPKMITLVVKKTGTTSCSVEFWLDKTLATTQIGAYPLATPVTGSPTPRLSVLEGYGTKWNGVIHRIQVATIDPTFNATTWVTREYDLNAPRFMPQ